MACPAIAVMFAPINVAVAKNRVRIIENTDIIPSITYLPDTNLLDVIQSTVSSILSDVSPIIGNKSGHRVAVNNSAQLAHITN